MPKPSKSEFFKLTEWTVKKGLDCLKRIVHEDMLPQLSDDEKNTFRDPEVFGNEKMKKFLEFIHQKSNGKLEIFGSVSELLDDMCHIARMLLEGNKFSDAITEISEDLVKTSGVEIITDNNGKEFYTKCDLCFLFGQLKRKHVMTSLCDAFFESWFLDFFNRRFHDFKGSFEFVPTSVWSGFVDAFEEALNLSKYQVPVVRHFENNDSQFLLAKEVDTALRLAMKRRYPDKVYPEGFLHVESEKEKNLGILYSIHKDALNIMLSILNLSKDSISVITWDLSRNFQHICFPIVSSYGTQCKLATDGFHDILNYLINVLGAFRGVKKENLPNIWKWIEGLENLFVVEKTLYLIETKKIDELIKKAREELQVYITEPIYEVPIKRSYTKEESFNEVKKLMGFFDMNAQLFETFYGHMTTDSKGKPLTIKYIYEIYYQFMRYELQKVNKKLEQFLLNQMDFCGFELVDSSSFKSDKTIIPPQSMKTRNMEASSSSKAESKKNEKSQFSGMKKGFLNAKSAGVVNNESKEEKVDGQKPSNSDSEVEKKNEETDELQRQLAQSDEKSRNEENQQIEMLRKELEESRKANALIGEANKMKAGQIKNYQDEVQKMKTDAENREMELEQKTEEAARYQKEIEDLKKILGNKENELKSRQYVIDSTRDEVVKLTENLEKVKMFFETSKNAETSLQKQNEEMKAKIEKQAAENTELKFALNEKSHKNEEFEKWLESGFEKFLNVQKLKEGKTNSEVQERLDKYQRILCIDYNDLLDALSSNLHRLSRYHPTSPEILLAKSQVANFDENYEDYIKNIRAEIRKIRENPSISIGELGDEMKEFPDQGFMKKYNKWVRDNNLE